MTSPREERIPWRTMKSTTRPSASVVVPIDKLSIVLTVAFSYLFLHERLSRRALLGLVAFQLASAKIGGDLMDSHLLSGDALAALGLFRVVWGFVGSRYARFSSFRRGVGPTLGAAPFNVAGVVADPQRHRL